MKKRSTFRRGRAHSTVPKQHFQTGLINRGAGEGRERALKRLQPLFKDGLFKMSFQEMAARGVI